MERRKLDTPVNTASRFRPPATADNEDVQDPFEMSTCENGFTALSPHQRYHTSPGQLRTSDDILGLLGQPVISFQKPTEFPFPPPPGKPTPYRTLHLTTRARFPATKQLPQLSKWDSQLDKQQKPCPKRPRALTSKWPAKISSAGHLQAQVPVPVMEHLSPAAVFLKLNDAWAIVKEHNGL